MCHREPGGTAPVLAGERFTKTFSDATLQTVFTTIKTTMPRNAPGSLSDAEYVDLVAHLLKINSYADGMNELARRRPARDQDSRTDRQPGLRARAGRRMPGAERPRLDVEPRHRTRAHARARGAQGRCGGTTRRGAARASARSGCSRSTARQPDGRTRRSSRRAFSPRPAAEERVNVTSMRTLTSSLRELRYNFHP